MHAVMDDDIDHDVGPLDLAGYNHSWLADMWAASNSFGLPPMPQNSFGLYSSNLLSPISSGLLSPSSSGLLSPSSSGLLSLSSSGLLSPSSSGLLSPSS